MENRDMFPENPSLETLFRHTRQMGGRDFNAAMNAVFSGSESDTMKKRFMKGERIDFARERINLDKHIELLQATVERQKKDLEKKNNQISMLEKEVEELEAQEKILKGRIERAKTRLYAARSEREDSWEEIDMDRAVLKNAMEEATKIGKPLLVHRSATINQLLAYPKGSIFVSSADVELVAEGIHDVVIYEKENYNHVDVIPECMRVLPPAIQAEYIAYANMVLDYKKRGLDFVACYTAPEIGEIIKANLTD